jgi:hypothetical protein
VALSNLSSASTTALNTFIDERKRGGDKRSYLKTGDIDEEMDRLEDEITRQICIMYLTLIDTVDGILFGILSTSHVNVVEKDGPEKEIEHDQNILCRQNILCLLYDRIVPYSF